MKYAVVDIETTGGYASGNGITEISIHIHDGDQVVETWETLINPEQYIPSHIEALTGINNEMVASAPTFEAVASKIHELLQDKVFIAHNVNFDYSFIRHHLSLCGFTLNCKKLCTVRLSRKLFPGHPSYSLGKLCTSLGINLENRHRAGGDAAATAILFGMLIKADLENVISGSLDKASKEQALPPHLSKNYIDRLPSNPGVYYFKDQKGKVIYIGKAKNLKKRVLSHFTGNNITKQRQEFLKNIHNIDYEICGTELMAFILEATEIKRLWPENNKALKRFEQKYALYEFEDQNGYIRLGIDKYKKQCPALYTFNSILDGHNLLKMLIKEHNLCEKLCFVQRDRIACTAHQTGTCYGACVREEEPSVYNIRVQDAKDRLAALLPTFAVIDRGRTDDEQSCLWIEKGKFYGMGYLSHYADVNDLDQVKSALQPYPSNDYIINLVRSYAESHPEKKLSLNFQPTDQ
jgi:DNA polymerase-3 subunit epsilon